MGGFRCPDEAIEQLRSLGQLGIPELETVRRQLAPGAPEAELKRLARVGAKLRPEVVRAVVDMFNKGYPGGAGASAFEGPVLLVRGASDETVTRELLASATARFGHGATVTEIDGSSPLVAPRASRCGGSRDRPVSRIDDGGSSRRERRLAVGSSANHGDLYQIQGDCSWPVHLGVRPCPLAPGHAYKKANTVFHSPELLAKDQYGGYLLVSERPVIDWARPWPCRQSVHFTYWSS